LQSDALVPSLQISPSHEIIFDLMVGGNCSRDSSGFEKYS
jgi:hypothetical protein